MSRRGFLSLSAGAGAAFLAACTSANAPGTRPAPTSVPSGATGSAVAASGRRDTPEFRMIGTTAWRINKLGADDAVMGYADRTSVLAGESFGLHISSTAKTARIDAYRFGWYQHKLARLVWSKDGVEVGPQPKPRYAAATRTVSADWDRTLTVPTDGWPDGAYLIKLTTADGERYVPMVVRAAETAGKIVLVHATATYQAYNTWGGRSLYQGPGGPDDYAGRSRVVSFDRPYDGDGSGKFLVFERTVVALINQLRLPVAHVTSAQVDTDPDMLKSAAAIVSLGHDEYWTPRMRRNVTAARDHGVNLAFLGANACFRRIRFQSAGGRVNRQVVCYKSDFRSDPMYGKHDDLVTTDYRVNPGADPECTLTGTLYEAFPAIGAFTVLTPDSWLFAGTGVKKGDTFEHLVGPEYDRVNPMVELPRPMQVVAHSPIICKGTKTYSDAAYYTTSSGAGVFTTGTMDWVRSVLRPQPPRDLRTMNFVTQVTTNVLSAFAQGPAAAKYPAQDNLDDVKPYKGDPTFLHHDLW